MLVETAVIQVEPQGVPVVFARHPKAERLIVAGTGGVLEELQGYGKKRVSVVVWQSQLKTLEPNNNAHLCLHRSLLVRYQINAHKGVHGITGTAIRWPQQLFGLQQTHNQLGALLVGIVSGRGDRQIEGVD